MARLGLWPSSSATAWGACVATGMMRRRFMSNFARLVLVDGEETLLGLLPRVAEEEEEKLALGQRAGRAA
ncbi:hypothetical protein E2562_021725 [Oryza meyeriana var. granulata]|uniref:Uncharacterized protein n=1 Tax=Oryza meyeriana var. granulata TaxID=110450 RepID=A0A6G1E0W7_9ORYZ|nr:hypothetical protein E2562_021725 [Oryza meyeriana var. granulata]